MMKKVSKMMYKDFFIFLMNNFHYDKNIKFSKAYNNNNTVQYITFNFLLSNISLLLNNNENIFQHS